MNKRVLAALSFLAVSTQAEPVAPTDLALRNTINLAADLGIAGNSMFNPRYFDGDVYVNQINVSAFGRYPVGSTVPSLLMTGTPEHRMIAPFRGGNSTIYLFGASGAVTTTFSRYDFAGGNQVDVEVPGGAQTSEGFDWVDEDTIIYTTYNPSANRKRLSLADVVADPFSVLPNTQWNANGFINTSVSTRIRNVRVGDVYSGYAYYGDSGQNSNPQFFAVNLETGTETLLGNAGTLTGGGSFGVWTVLERGGYLYVQTTDNGIQIYEMTSGNELGDLVVTYSKERLDELTGYTGQYYGLDVSPEGSKLLLGGAQGAAYELAPVPKLTLRNSIHLAADLGIAPSSMFNPRIFDGHIYVNQINIPAFGRYPLGSPFSDLLMTGTPEHRMVARFRGANSTVYLFGASGASTTTFSRYDYTGENLVDVAVPGEGQTSEGFDWVDEDTIIYTTYNPSANRKRLSLADVVAEPFSVTPNTQWNENGFITTSVSTRIRNVRVGDVYSGYAYYGDSGQNSNPQFFALNLETGTETLLGNAGVLTGGGSFGVWTVVERGGYLYVQTTDNGIQVYQMTSATSLGDVYATYTKAEIDEATGYIGQYYGLDVSSDGTTLVLGGAEGIVYELEAHRDEPLALHIARQGGNVVLSWPDSATDAVIQGSTTVEGFSDLDPQPLVESSGNGFNATVPISGDSMFFRLRK